MRKVLVVILVLAGAWLLYRALFQDVQEPPAPGEVLLWDLREAKERTLAQALPDLSPPGLVYLGESHGSLLHHETQLAVIQALEEHGAKVAVGLEMLQHAQQQYLDQWVAGELPERRMREVFLKDWGYEWRLYRPIFVYCKEQDLPMVALNVPRSITRKVARQGFQSLTDQELGQLPPISCNVHPDYENFLRRVLGGHGGSHGTESAHSDDQSFTRFCEAQLVWDTAMAIYALDFLESNPDHTMAVLCGSVHAWKLAIPSQAERLTPGLRQRVLLPFVPGRLTPEQLTSADADYVSQQAKDTQD